MSLTISYLRKHGNEISYLTGQHHYGRAKPQHDNIMKLHGPNHNILKISAFETRIDKSQAYRCTSELAKISTILTTSPYFHKSNGRQLHQQPLLSSLMKHEAEQYGYKIPCSEQQNEVRTSTQASHKGTTNLILFEPSLTKGLIRGASRSAQERLRSGKSSLRDNLNRNVLRATRVAMTNACRRYPPILSRSALDKYSHLFGLESIRQNKSGASLKHHDLHE